MTETVDLVRVSLNEQFGVELEVSWVFIVGALVLSSLVVLIRIILFRRNSGLEFDQAELGLGDQKVTIRPNYLDIQVAYKLWVELSTRKLALPFDEENDIVVDVYKSWFEYFKVAREHIKEIPVQRLRNKNTQKLVSLVVGILNAGIRPHLTRWHGRFGAWYAQAIEDPENRGIEPQVLQRRYSKYGELVKELSQVNTKLASYRNKLEVLVLQKSSPKLDRAAAK